MQLTGTATPRSGALTFSLLATLLALAGTVRAQDDAIELQPWQIDPYTENDPKVLERMGYVSYGPFPFGERGGEATTSTVVQEHLSYVRILWVETAHFRIGSSLDRWTVPIEKETRAKIRAELTELKERFRDAKAPGASLNPKMKVLDEWIRLHLFAQRMENHYATFQDLLGVEDEDFPESPDKMIIAPGKVYMGQGPYLGMKEKYTLLLCERSKTFGDYLRGFTGRPDDKPQRWHFTAVGSLFYGMGVDGDGGKYKHDTGLHANVVYNVTQNMVDGFRHYSYDLPIWIKTGLAHYFERRVSPRWNSFDEDEGTLIAKKSTWNWEPYVRRLIASDKNAPFSEVYTWRQFGQMDFDEHILNWSRWDFLMSKGKEPFRKFMFGVKGRVNPENWMPDQSDLVGATRDALQEAYGLNPLNFDERWKEWIVENYATR